MADSIALNLYDYKPDGLAKFAAIIYKGFIAKAVDFPGPKPTMPTFLNHINKLNDVLVKWGGKGNRGAHTDNKAVIAAVKVIRKDLRLLAAFATNTQPDNPKLWVEVGFALEQDRTKAGTLQEVQNLHHFIARNIPAPHEKLKWKRPLDSKRYMIKGYIIQWNTKNEYPESSRKGMLMNVIGIVTETSFIDEHPSPGANWYWVTPYNSAGLGVRSNPLRIVSAQLEEEE